MPPPIKQLTDNETREVPFVALPSKESKDSTRPYAILLVVLNVVIIVLYVFLFGYVVHKKNLTVESLARLNSRELKEDGLRALKEVLRNTESGDRTHLEKGTSYYF